MRGSLSGSCVSNIACNVDASETIDAARQLGVDAAVSGGGGNAAAVGYCPGDHGTARTSADCAANACAGDPRTATFPRHTSRHHAYSPHHRDPATGATNSAATGTGRPCPSPTRTRRERQLPRNARRHRPLRPPRLRRRPKYSIEHATTSSRRLARRRLPGAAKTSRRCRKGATLPSRRRCCNSPAFPRIRRLRETFMSATSTWKALWLSASTASCCLTHSAPSVNSSTPASSAA
jgi:hypothetical protein